MWGWLHSLSSHFVYNGILRIEFNCYYFDKISYFFNITLNAVHKQQFFIHSFTSQKKQHTTLLSSTISAAALSRSYLLSFQYIYFVIHLVPLYFCVCFTISHLATNTQIYLRVVVLKRSAEITSFLLYKGSSHQMNVSALSHLHKKQQAKKFMS